MTSKKYFKLFLVLMVIAIAVTTVFNALVDPFDILGVPKIVGLNADKPEIKTRPRLAKPYVVKRECPANLIVGNSRSIAFDAHYVAWPTTNNYNYSLTSGSVYEIYRSLQHAVAACNIKLVLLSLDFLSFLKNAGDPSTFREYRLLVTKEGTPTAWKFNGFMQDAIPAVLSFSALKSSVRTIKKQSSQVNNNQPQSKYRCHAPIMASPRILVKGGHKVFIDEANRGTIKNLIKVWDKQFSDIAFTYLQKIYDLAYSKGIKLIIVVPPSHISLFEQLYKNGFQSILDEWYTSIILHNERIAKKYNLEAYKIIDFSGINSVTTERIPSEHEVDVGMKWFWESLHFNADAANLILDRVFGHHREDCPVPADFGIEISSQNIGEHLAKRTQAMSSRLVL